MKERAEILGAEKVHTGREKVDMLVSTTSTSMGRVDKYSLQYLCVCSYLGLLWHQEDIGLDIYRVLDEGIAKLYVGGKK